MKYLRLFLTFLYTINVFYILDGIAYIILEYKIIGKTDEFFKLISSTEIIPPLLFVFWMFLNIGILVIIIMNFIIKDETKSQKVWIYLTIIHFCVLFIFIFYIASTIVNYEVLLKGLK